MVESNQVELIGDLRARWQRWTAMVRLVASRQEQRFAVDPDEYHELHAGLLRLCRVSASRADATAQPMYAELEEIISPWVNFDALVWADREIISKLLARCEMVQQVLDGRPARRTIGNPRKLAWLAVVAVVAGAVILMWATGFVSPPRLGAPTWIRRVIRVANSSGPNRQLLIFGAIAMLIAITFVWRSVRWT